MSYYALDRQLGGQMLGAGERRIPTDDEQYRQRFAELAQNSRLVAPRFGYTDNCQAPTDSRRAVTTHSNDRYSHTLGRDSESVGDGSQIADTTTAVGSIIQITVATFIELVVQPHQVRISSGSGGGSDKGGWNDEHKNKSRRRR